MKNKQAQKLISSILFITIMAPSIFLSMSEKAEAALGVGDINIESGSVIVDNILDPIYRAEEAVTSKAGVFAHF